MADSVIQHMRARAEQCRRLADLITSDTVRQQLREMAQEIERDVRKLQGEQPAASE